MTATDAAGNQTTTSFGVTVQDTTPPDLTVPADIVVEATSAAGAVVDFAASATRRSGEPVRSLLAGIGFDVRDRDDDRHRHRDRRVRQPARRRASTSPSGHDAAGPDHVRLADIVVEATSAAGAVVDLRGLRDRDRHGRARYDHLFAGIRARRSRSGRRPSPSPRPTPTATVGRELRRDGAGHDAAGITSPRRPRRRGDQCRGRRRRLTRPPRPRRSRSSPVTISYSQASGSTFAIGTTIVTVTATDAYDNSSTASFDVKVAGHDAADDHVRLAEPRRGGNQRRRRRGHLRSGEGDRRRRRPSRSATRRRPATRSRSARPPSPSPPPTRTGTARPRPSPSPSATPRRPT